MRRIYCLFLITACFSINVFAQGNTETSALEEKRYKKIIWRNNASSGRFFSDFKKKKSNDINYTIFELYTNIYLTNSIKIASHLPYCSDTNSNIALRDTTYGIQIADYWKRRTERVLTAYKFKFCFASLTSMPSCSQTKKLLFDLEALYKSVNIFPSPKFIADLIDGVSTEYSILFFLDGWYQKHNWGWSGKNIFGTNCKEYGDGMATMIVVNNLTKEIVFVNRRFEAICVEKPETTDFLLVDLLKSLKYF